MEREARELHRSDTGSGPAQPGSRSRRSGDRARSSVATSCRTGGRPRPRPGPMPPIRTRRPWVCPRPVATRLRTQDTTWLRSGTGRRRQRGSWRRDGTALGRAPAVCPSHAHLELAVELTEVVGVLSQELRQVTSLLTVLAHGHAPHDRAGPAFGRARERVLVAARVVRFGGPGIFGLSAANGSAPHACFRCSLLVVGSSASSRGNLRPLDAAIATQVPRAARWGRGPPVRSVAFAAASRSGAPSASGPLRARLSKEYGVTCLRGNAATAVRVEG